MINRDLRSLQPSSARKRNLFSHVVEHLGSQIVGGAFKPCETLPNEADLGRALGASRSVVREAVKSLAAKGLLELRTRVGTRVLPPTNWNLLDLDVLGWRYASMPRMQFFRELFEMRGMIEPEAAALAAQRATDSNISAIRQAYQDMETAEQTSDAAIDADIRFHRAILAAGRNDLLLQTAALISAGLLVSFRISSESFGVFLPQHKRVLNTIAARDADAAREAMKQLLADTRSFLEIELAGSVKKEQLLARTREVIDQEFSRDS
jgi:GntR family transcriptional regulator, galactonate operon transcriptional repressor